jgi:hypothetical protein
MSALMAGESQVFLIALAVMLMIALLEGVASLLGAGLSGVLDSLLPDVDADVTLDIDLDGPQSSPPALSRFLSWLRIGEVPVLMLLVIFLAAFGLIGLAMQSMAYGVTGSYLPQWIAVVPALLVAFPLVRLLGGLLAIVLPKDETTAVSEASFVGRIATLTLGSARLGSPAQAKLVDEHGQVHYVMVEPDSTSETFLEGAQVLITERRGAVFRGILNPTSALVD